VTCATAGALETQLADAAKAGNVVAVRALLAKKADVNAATVDSSTPLHLAVKAEEPRNRQPADRRRRQREGRDALQDHTAFAGRLQRKRRHYRAAAEGRSGRE